MIINTLVVRKEDHPKKAVDNIKSHVKEKGQAYPQSLY